jgi:hypothetical protein
MGLLIVSMREIKIIILPRQYNLQWNFSQKLSEQGGCYKDFLQKTFYL